MYLKIRAGLLDPKHVATMGTAVWLYLWLHGRVQFTGEAAGRTFDQQPYKHGEAAAALGVSVRQVQRWFDTLRGEYLTATRVRYGYQVTLTKYAAPARPDVAVQSPAAQTGQICREDRTDLSRHPDTDVQSHQIPIHKTPLEIQIPFTGDAPAARSAPRPIVAVPKPNRYGEVIEAIRARGLEYEPDPADAAAVKRSALAPALIAEVYEAIARGTWGDDFNRRQLSVRHAIGCFNAYRSARALPPPPGRRKGSSSASSRVDEVFARQGIFDEPNGYAAAGGCPRPAVGYGEVGGRLPGQLLG